MKAFLTIKLSQFLTVMSVDEEEEELEGLHEVTEDSSSVEESSLEISLESLSHSVSSFLITSDVSGGSSKSLKSDP